MYYGFFLLNNALYRYFNILKKVTSDKQDKLFHCVHELNEIFTNITPLSLVAKTNKQKQDEFVFKTIKEFKTVFVCNFKLIIQIVKTGKNEIKDLRNSVYFHYVVCIFCSMIRTINRLFLSK